MSERTIAELTEIRVRLEEVHLTAADLAAEDNSPQRQELQTLIDRTMRDE